MYFKDRWVSTPRTREGKLWLCLVVRDLHDLLVLLYPNLTGILYGLYMGKVAVVGCWVSGNSSAGIKKSVQWLFRIFQSGNHVVWFLLVIVLWIVTTLYMFLFGFFFYEVRDRTVPVVGELLWVFLHGFSSLLFLAFCISGQRYSLFNGTTKSCRSEVRPLWESYHG